MKVYLGSGIKRGVGGISRALESLYDYLPDFGCEIVGEINQADVMNAHIGVYEDIPNNLPLVVSSHGLLWEEHNWGSTGKKINNICLNAYLLADVVTAPSQFVATAIQRHTLQKPLIVRHGIDTSLWQPQPSQGYVLWNKTRKDQSCDPTIVNKLASLLPNTNFVTTFGNKTSNVKVIGALPHLQMKMLVESAGVYLDTPKESGGPCFGVLEAMAAGVPVVAYNDGGNAEAILHKETGYLAVSEADLIDGIQYCYEHRERLGSAARDVVEKNYTVQQSVASYVEAYETALYKLQTEVDVSIIIPAYNLDQYVGNAISSALNQTHDSVEVIVVNDASTDLTEEVLKRFEDPKLTVLTNDTNLHVSDSRNRAIAEARGRYILPLDADDELTTTAVEHLLPELESDKALYMVAGKLLLSNEQGTIKDQLGQWPDDADLVKQLKGFNRLPYSTLYRKRLWENIGGYRRRIKNGIEDADFWTRALSYGYKARVIDKPTLRYLMRNNSLGKQNAEGNEAWLKWFPWTTNVNTRPAGIGGPVISFDPPLVSVVVPVGPGHAQHLQACFDSLVAQSETNWEMVVVNDTGNAWFDENRRSLTRYLDGIAANFVDSAVNHGVAWARNRGIEAARGKYIIFLDVDDIAQPGMVSALVSAHKVVDGWIYGDWYHKSNDETKLNNAPNWNAKRFITKQLAPVTGLYRRDHLMMVGGFDEDAPGWEDWEMQIRLFGRGICGTRVQYPLIMYNMDFGQRREENFADAERVLQYIQTKHMNIFEAVLENNVMPCKTCGGKSTVSVGSSTTNIKNNGEIQMLDINMVKIVYKGNSRGKRRFRPPNAGRFYVIRNPGDIINVHPDDVEFFTRMADFERADAPDSVAPVPEMVMPLESATNVKSDLDSFLDKYISPAAEVEVEQETTVSSDEKVTGLMVLDLSPKVVMALEKAGVKTAEDVAKMSDGELLAVKGIGDASLEEIKEKVEEWVSNS